MKDRCFNPNSQAYKFYGGRGITVCSEWRNDLLYFYYWALANSYSEELTIDRVDNNGNYEPSNCRWATRVYQTRNRRNTKTITYNGETLPLAEWAEKLNLCYTTLNTRIKAGWNLDEVMVPNKYRSGAKLNNLRREVGK